MFEHLNDSELAVVDGAGIIPDWVMALAGWYQARRERTADEYGLLAMGG